MAGELDKYTSSIKLRPNRLAQCGHCNIWHEPEKLDLDGECEECNVLLPLREELRGLKARGLEQGSEAAELCSAISEVLILKSTQNT